MITVQLLLLILALICFLLAALRVEAPKVNVLALGFVFWMLALILKPV